MKRINTFGLVPLNIYKKENERVNQTIQKAIYKESVLNYIKTLNTKGLVIF